MSVFVQYVPPKIHGRDWTDEDRNGFKNTVLDMIGRYSPNFKSLIRHVEVRTPDIIENETGLTEGNIFQGELTLDQLLFNRPFPGFAQYRGPTKGFSDGSVAAEMVRAEGIPVESVIIDDDVAVQNSTWTAGRRGVGATVLAEKLCGAAAEDGRPLAAIRDLCTRVNARARSMGIALTSCTVPHVGKPTFDLPEEEMEVGVGIHGEPGRKRTKLLPADEIVELLMEPVLNDLPFKSGDEVLLFVNGLGGTPTVELFIVYRKAAEIAKRAGLKVTRNLVGSYITSLEMAGTSITLLKLDEELTLLWDSPVNTPALRKGV